ncbi:MAG: glycosyltransferase [Promethearchaeota archaeon]
MKFISPDTIHRYIKMLSQQGLNIQFEENIEKIKKSNLPLIIWNPYGYLTYNQKKYLDKWELYQWYRQNNKPVYIVERGAFPNQIFIDHTGFNVESTLLNSKKWDIPLTKKQSYQIDNYLEKFKKDKSTLEKQKLSNIETIQKISNQFNQIIFVPLQVEKDTVIQKWAGEIKSVENFFNWIKQLAEKYPDYLFLVKNHPCNNRKFKINLPNALLVDDYHYKELIKISDYILTINSGIGIQATVWNKCVITIGKTFYESVIQSCSLKFAETILQLKYEWKPNQKRLRRFLYYLLFQYYTSCEIESLEGNISRPTKLKIIRYYDLEEHQYKEIKKIEFLNIVYLFNEYGWAFEFEANSYQKYSKHNIIPLHYNPFKFMMYEKDYDNIMRLNPDIVVFPSALHYTKIYNAYGKKLIKNNIKVVVQVNSHYEENHFCQGADLIMSSSRKLYDIIQEKFNYNLMVKQHHFVDTEIFKYKKTVSTNIIGWAGKIDNPIKRSDLLLKLGYPILIKSNYYSFLTPEKNRQKMNDFYHQIDILLITSKQEGSPYPLLEAMACGKVVLSTDVGIAPEILSPDCIIYGETEQELIEGFQKKIKYLLKHPKQLIQLGKRNYQYIKENLEWKTQYQKLDELYTTLYKTSRKTKDNEIRTINEFINILVKLNNFQINYWLEGSSCLEAVRFKELNSNPYHLIIASDEYSKIEALLIKSQWEKRVNKFHKNKYIITLKKTNKCSTKKMELFGLKINVPYPVVTYLKKLYGDNWKTINITP